jgi:[ribosomal protein S18]-alanine N-acetyltransferase
MNATMAAVGITLRLARSRDAATLAQMSRDLIEAGLSWRYRPEAVARLIADRETIAIVACEESRVAGFAVLQLGDERGHLVLLAVNPAYRRRGIGRRMLDWLLASARTAGIASVHLELRAGNAVARAFYRSMGFSETLLVPGYYSRREAALRMIRVLRSSDALPPWDWRTLLSG